MTENLTFETVEFRVDPATRRIEGLILPYNRVAVSDGRRWRFAPGAVDWDRSAVSRVKLLRDHSWDALLGAAVSLTETDDGIRGSYKVARNAAGDQALLEAEDGALDGFSVGVAISDYVEDPDDATVNLVTKASLQETSLTPRPAFTDARVTSVAASATHREEPSVPDIQTEATDTTAFTTAVEAFTAAVEKMGAPQGADRPVIPAARAAGFQVTEAPVYSFEAGRGPSFVRDTFAARVNDDPDATDRLRKFQAQQQEMAAFATVNRTGGAAVIPPGYKPDMYLPQLFQGRPLLDMVSKGSLSDATPFTIPKFTSASGATADHVEGTNPSDGTLTLGTVTVTPGAISGRFRITREMVDAANPAIDAIALNALKESYSQQTEGKVYALLNGAAGVGGTITSGTVPSGAAVVTATGAGSSGAAGVALIGAVRQQMVEYPFRRFAQANRLAVSSEAAVQLAKACDSTGRPLLPRLGATNAVGQGSAYAGAFDLDGLAATPAWSMTGNAAGDADTIMFNSQDVWAWESNLLVFRYEEVAGPANIDLVLFGYFAAQVLRGSGLSAVRLTVS